MKISNFNNSNWIAITRIERETEYIPCICIAIEIQTILHVSFDATECVWLSDWQIKQFITELKELDITRNGVAVLESPNVFFCSISNLDNLGHLYLKVKMSNGSESDEYYKLETGFEIDAGNIHGIINGFRELIEEKKID
jgi:hypothetical protein